MRAEHISCPMVCADTLVAHWQASGGLTILDTACDNAQTVLSVWSALRQHATPEQPLHIITMASHVVSPEAIRAHALAGQSALVDLLSVAWPPDVPGFHRLLFDQGKVVVTLLIGPWAEMLAALSASVDVFYLKQDVATLLTSHHVKRLGQLARIGAQYISVAQGAEQPALLQAGGFVLDTVPLREDIVQARYAPRGNRRVPRDAAVAARQAIVIGAGLAGAAIAERLTARGWHVTVFEAGSAPAQEASGNLAGVYMPMISQDDNPATRFNRAAYLFAQQLWAQLGGVGDALLGEACGVLQVARDDDQQAAFQRAAQKWQYPASFARWLDSETASRQLGMATRGGWLFPQAGWLRPASVCAAMFAAAQTHAGELTLACATTVTGLRYDNLQWSAISIDGQVLASAPTVILANGIAARHLDIGVDIPLSAIRGQVSHVPATCLPTLPYVLCGDGYMTRAHAGVVSVGATYGVDTGQGVETGDHLENMGKLQQLLPQLNPVPDVATLSGRVGLRCVTPDRMPLIGTLPDPLAQGMKGLADKGLPAVPRYSGLYCLLGYASRGLITAPLAAEMLVCQLTGAPMPVGRDLQEAVDPARFVLRASRKRQQ